MSLAMPEFEMPPEDVAPPPVAAAPPAAPPPAEDRAPEPGPVAGARLPWRRLLVVGLVGVLVGSALPAALQAADRAAADAQVEGLRSSASAYLRALADGDAGLATAMVPVQGDRTALDALRAAERLHGFEVRQVTVVGDVARVEVHFEVGSVDEDLVLEAERVDASWRLTTSLAERVTVHAAAGAPGTRIGGVELRDATVHLYPGRYTTDARDTAMLRYGGDAVQVDGDPATPAELHASAQPTEELERAVLAVADRRIEACRQQPECPFDADAVLSPNRPSIIAVDPPAGAVDVSVQIGAARGLGDQWHELHVRALSDAAGGLASWECAPIGAPDAAMQPCGP